MGQLAIRDTEELAFTVLFAAVLVFWIGGWLIGSVVKEEGSCEARVTFEREAVQHGAATWTVDADGERVFTWNESEVRDGE